MIIYFIGSRNTPYSFAMDRSPTDRKLFGFSNREYAAELSFYYFFFLSTHAFSAKRKINALIFFIDK